MAKNMKRIILILIVLCGMLLFANISEVQAGDLNLKNLNYDIQLNTNGSMDVVETWNIQIEDTNTLFKTFERDGGYSSITDVQVYEINSDGTKVPFTQINQEMYHVTKGSYYALVNSNNKFEIAWGVSVQNATKTYEISYKVNDCVSVYNDCAEVFWQLISTDSAIPADRVTGTIKLQKPVDGKENLRAWVHGPLNGNLSIDSEDTVSFELDYLDAGTVLSFRVLSLDITVFNEATTIDENEWENILVEEMNLANIANEQRARYAMYRNIAIGVVVLTMVFILWKIVKYVGIIRRTPKIKPSMEIDYFRDIPDEKATPAEAAFLYYFDKNGMGTNISKVVSATMMNLALKKYIEFSIDNSKRKEQIRITILGNADENGEELKADESVVYNILKDVGDTFTMKELEKYAKKYYETFLDRINSIKEKAGKNLEEQKMYDPNVEKKASGWIGKAILYLVICIIVCAFGLVGVNVVIGSNGPIATILAGALAILMVIIVAQCSILNSRTRTLTQEGVDEAAKWKGLKKYMGEFSLLNEREVPELVLWEKYLVYATAFGIADKVLKQLKMKYPQLIENDDYIYMPLIYSNAMHNGFLNALDRSVSNVYSAGLSERAMQSGYSGGNSSSGGGFGGGFSRGGGGFGGGAMGGR